MLRSQAPPVPATSILLSVEHSCAAVLPPNHAKIKIKKQWSEYYTHEGGDH